MLKFTATIRVINTAIKWLSVIGLTGYLLALALIILRAPHQPVPEFGEVHQFVITGVPILYVTESLYRLMELWFGGLFGALLSVALLRSLLRSFKSEKDGQARTLVLGSEPADHSVHRPQH